MVDRDRILSKVAELDAYVRELDSIRPASREEFNAIEKKSLRTPPSDLD